ncbi:DegT/DnrJ/EryC1/StrS aminotransferase [Hyaloraphidium curvatum]|nr:DegT/DnrJ/EryC1/StrS aminotransferase [Hyaloraphidium curvatum]
MVDGGSAEHSVRADAPGKVRGPNGHAGGDDSQTTPSPPFIPVARPDLSGNEAAYVLDCVQSGWVSSQGAYVTRFEAALEALCGVPALAVSSGTAGLHLALAALGVGKSDEVLVPGYTFAATANAVLLAGAAPVLVDVDEYGGMDPQDAESKCSPATRALIAVDLYGVPADWDALRALAARRNLLLVADAAESLGASYGPETIGGLSDVDASVFSFFANKTATTGEGGAVLLRSAPVLARARMLRDHGMRPGKRYWHDEPGFNYRLSNLPAAVGCAQLERLDSFLASRAAAAELYDALFAPHGDLLVPAARRPGCTPSHWVYVLQLRGPWTPDARDSFLKELLAEGVETRPGFYPLHRMAPYAGLRGAEEGVPRAEELADRAFGVPLFSGITEGEVRRVVETVVGKLKARHARGGCNRGGGLGGGRA